MSTAEVVAPTRMTMMPMLSTSSVKVKADGLLRRVRVIANGLPGLDREPGNRPFLKTPSGKGTCYQYWTSTSWLSASTSIAFLMNALGGTNCCHGPLTSGVLRICTLVSTRVDASDATRSAMPARVK